MSKQKRARPRRMPAPPPPGRRRSQRKRAAALGIVIALCLTGGLLAQWRAVPLKTGSPPAIAPTPTPSPLSLAKEYVYVGGKLVAIEEPASGGPGLTAPTSFTATTFSKSRIDLQWAASSGPLHHYQIERSENSPNNFTVLTATPTTNSFSDTAVTEDRVYLYRVRAVDASGNVSLESNLDLAVAVTFDGETRIKADHVRELRKAIDAIRTVAGIGAFSWTVSSLQLAGAAVRASDFTELRTALDQAFVALGLPVKPYSPGLAAGQFIKLAQLNDLRDHVR